MNTHSQLFSIILDAAANSPADPLAYKDGILMRYLEHIRRKKAEPQTSEDCFASEKISLSLPPRVPSVDSNL